MTVIKNLNYTKEILRLDRLHWVLPVELDPELQHTCSPLEQHEMIGKGCGYSERKQERERAPSLAPNAGPEGCSWATAKLEDERLLYHLVLFSKVLRAYAGRWEALLCLAIS